MPLIIFEGPPMSTDAKRRLVRMFTEAACQATGLGKEIITTVIHVNAKENIATGGELLADRLAGEAGVPKPAE